jgi:hypothetical protein
MGGTDGLENAESGSAWLRWSRDAMVRMCWLRWLALPGRDSDSLSIPPLTLPASC